MATCDAGNVVCRRVTLSMCGDMQSQRIAAGTTEVDYTAGKSFLIGLGAGAD